MQYRVELPATIYLTVEADSAEQAITLAGQAISDYENGYKLNGGDDYSDVVLYADPDGQPVIADEGETV